MTDAGKKALSKLTREQSDSLTSRIIAAMEDLKTFRKSQVVGRCYYGVMDNIRCSQEAVKYGVQAVIDLFLQTGMLTQDGKVYHIAMDGKKVEDK